MSNVPSPPGAYVGTSIASVAINGGQGFSTKLDATFLGKTIERLGNDDQ
jgi:hypothetical protein